MTDRDRPGPFEERLLAELKQVVAARADAAISPVSPPERRPAWKPRLALAAVVGALGAAGAIALPPLISQDSSMAYAVTTKPDGNVQVQIHHLSDADGLEDNLEEAGIPAEVDYLPMGKSCRQPRFARAPGRVLDKISIDGDDRGSLEFTLNPNDFSGDRTLVLEISGPKTGIVNGTMLLPAIAVGTVRPCEPE